MRALVNKENVVKFTTEEEYTNFIGRVTAGNRKAPSRQVRNAAAGVSKIKHIKINGVQVGKVK